MSKYSLKKLLLEEMTEEEKRSSRFERNRALSTDDYNAHSGTRKIKDPEHSDNNARLGRVKNRARSMEHQAAVKGGKATELLFRKVMNIQVDHVIGDGKTKVKDGTDMSVRISPTVTIHPDIYQEPSDTASTPKSFEKLNRREYLSGPGMRTFKQKEINMGLRGTRKETTGQDMSTFTYSKDGGKTWESESAKDLSKYAKSYVQGKWANVEIGFDSKRIFLGHTGPAWRFPRTSEIWNVDLGSPEIEWFKPFQYNTNIKRELRKYLDDQGVIVTAENFWNIFQRKIYGLSDIMNTADIIDARKLKKVSQYYLVKKEIPKAVVAGIWDLYGDDYYCQIDTRGGKTKAFLARASKAPVKDAIFWTDTAAAELKRTSFTWASTLDPEDELGVPQERPQLLDPPGKEGWRWVYPYWSDEPYDKEPYWWRKGLYDFDMMLARAAGEIRRKPGVENFDPLDALWGKIDPIRGGRKPFPTEEEYEAWLKKNESRYLLAPLLLENNRTDLGATFISEEIPLIKTIIKPTTMTEDSEGKVHLSWNDWDWDRALKLEVYPGVARWIEANSRR